MSLIGSYILYMYMSCRVIQWYGVNFRETYLKESQYAIYSLSGSKYLVSSSSMYIVIESE